VESKQEEEQIDGVLWLMFGAEPQVLVIALACTQWVEVERRYRHSRAAAQAVGERFLPVCATWEDLPLENSPPLPDLAA
jgi:hypothetical protein